MYTVYAAYGNHCAWQCLDAQDSSGVPPDEVLRLSPRLHFPNSPQNQLPAAQLWNKEKENTWGLSYVSYCTFPTNLTRMGLRELKHRPFFLPETKVLKEPVAPATPPSGTNAPLSTPRPQPLQPPLFVPISKDARQQDDGVRGKLRRLRLHNTIIVSEVENWCPVV